MGELIFGKGINHGGFTLGESVVSAGKSGGWEGWGVMADGSAMDNHRGGRRTEAHIEITRQHGPDDFEATITVTGKAGLRGLFNGRVRGSVRDILSKAATEQDVGEVRGGVSETIRDMQRGRGPRGGNDAPGGTYSAHDDGWGGE